MVAADKSGRSSKSSKPAKSSRSRPSGRSRGRSSQSKLEESEQSAQSEQSKQLKQSNQSEPSSPPPSSSSSSPSGEQPSKNKTISSIIFSHFDSYQRNNNDDNDKNAPSSSNAGISGISGISASALRAAASIREDISRLSLEALTASLDGMTLDPTSSSDNDGNKDDDGASEGANEANAANKEAKEAKEANDAKGAKEAKEATVALIRCLDSAMACIHYSLASASSSSSKKESWSESVFAVLELAAAFACSGEGSAGLAGRGRKKRGAAAANGANGRNGRKDDNGMMAWALIQRAAEYTLVERDAIRAEACKLLGWCVALLMDSLEVANGGVVGVVDATSVRKSGKVKRSSKDVNVGKVGMPGRTGKTDASSNDASDTEWKVECLLLAANALSPRLTDKIAKVRSAAIVACSGFFPPTNTASTANNANMANALCARGSERGIERANESATLLELAEATASITETLLFLLSSDSSAANRALATRACPANGETVAAIVERVKDVDVKVRDAALDCLRTKVGLDGSGVSKGIGRPDGLAGLEEDELCFVLRMGLMKRCPTTHAKTIELLLCHWLKQCRFNPITFLSKLNPMLNETVAESAARTIMELVNLVDCINLNGMEDLKDLSAGVKKGVELVC